MLEADDFYFEGDKMVFTEKYHLKRGVCCGNKCRHCPYHFAQVNSETQKPTQTYAKE